MIGKSDVDFIGDYDADSDYDGDPKFVFPIFIDITVGNSRAVVVDVVDIRFTI